MHTLFDFVSDVNKMQYGLSLLFILGFIFFLEIMKPKPFKNLVTSIADDAAYIRTQGKEDRVRLIKNILRAPVYFAVYFGTLPVLFLQGLIAAMGESFATVSSAGWNPVRAYFTGRKKSKKTDGSKSGKKGS